MRVIIFMTVVLMLAGCGRSRTYPQMMQRFDALGPELNRVTVGSRHVSDDVAAVDAKMSRGNIVATQNAAARLKVDALRLSKDAGHVGNRVRVLLSPSPGGKQQQYLSFVLSALRQQWMEGQNLRRVAEIVWGDPLILSPRDSRELAFTLALAERRAGAAVRYCGAATRLQERNPHIFRYVRIGAPGALPSQHG